MAIIGVVAFVGSFVSAFLVAISDLGLDPADWADLGSILRERFMKLNTFWGFVGATILALVVLFIFAFIAVLFFRKSLNLLSAKTGIGMFGTAGLLMLIGAILTIIIVGLILVWVAWILVAVAFFSIRTQPIQPQAPPPTKHANQTQILYLFIFLESNSILEKRILTFVKEIIGIYRGSS
mgnify:CR=1 FL=1